MFIVLHLINMILFQGILRIAVRLLHILFCGLWEVSLMTKSLLKGEKDRLGSYQIRLDENPLLNVLVDVLVEAVWPPPLPPRRLGSYPYSENPEPYDELYGLV
jgi:hypothetical protein